MRAEYLIDGTIAITGSERTEQFTRIWAGIGWPDREPGYLCVLGERTEGTYHALWEKTGGLWELGEAAVHAKDNFLLECLWVDARDAIATSYLRTLEGLCFAPTSPATGLAAIYPVRPIPGEPTTTVMSVPDKVTGNFRSALEKTRGVVMNGGLLIHEANCPKLVYTLRQPLEDLLGSPAMKALVWVVSALEAAKRAELGDDRSENAWYGNISRM